jgi:hypothetical protein
MNFDKRRWHIKDLAHTADISGFSQLGLAGPGHFEVLHSTSGTLV